MSSALLVGIVFAVAADPQLRQMQPADVERPPYGVRLHAAWIRMADGVRLAANILLPEGALPGQRFPAIFEYLPYRRTVPAPLEGTLLVAPGAPESPEQPATWYFVRRGYAGVRVDIRGTGRSEGRTPDREYSEEEQRDGVEAIAWIARQGFCDGSVGMWGISWGGFNSLQLAARQPPALKAIVAIEATEDLFQDDIHFIDGLMHYDEYELAMDLANAVTRAPDFPTDEASLALRFDEPPWSLIYKRHQRDGPFWDRASQDPPYERLRLPTFLIGGWLDGYRDSVPRMLQHMRPFVKAIVGPWNHDEPHDSDPGPRIEWRREAVRFWDRFLKGIRNGIEDEPRLSVYVRHWHPPGTTLREVPGEWVSEPGWPAPGLVERILHLQDGGRLAASPSAPRVHHLRYVPSTGVVAGFWWGELAPDQRPADAFSLVYESEPLEEDLGILGLPRARLYVSADAPLAHWFVRLSDVAPDGSVTLVTGAGVSGAHRDSAADPRLLTPGQVYPLDVELHFTSWVFPKGHRVRLAVSNALWPMIWPTPHAMTTSLHLGPDTPSRLLLPVRAPGERPRPSFLPVPMGPPRPPAAWPGEWRWSRDETGGTARVEWSGASTQEAPWGRSAHREQLVYDVEDARPEKAAIRGEVETRWELPGRTLVWRGHLDLTSDRLFFRYRFRRELLEDGRLVRQRTWKEDIPRDHQ